MFILVAPVFVVLATPAVAAGPGIETRGTVVVCSPSSPAVHP
jgi:hypothetical protein